MANNSCSTIPQVEEKKKHYTDHDVKRGDNVRQFQHISGQPMKLTLHVGDNNILQNLLMLQEDVGIEEGIYGPSVSHSQGKTVWHKVQNVDPIIVPNPSKEIFDRYKNIILCCDFMHINVIGFLNTIYWHIMFAMGSIIKIWKVKNIEYGIKQVIKLYLHSGFNITRIHADIECEQQLS